MIEPNANVARAKYAYRALKFNAIALVLVMPLGTLLSVFLEYALPSIAMNSTWLPLTLLTLIFTCYVLTAYWIATVAKDLAKNFPTWFLGSIVFGPLGMLVAFVRVRNLAKEYGIV